MEKETKESLASLGFLAREQNTEVSITRKNPANEELEREIRKNREKLSLHKEFVTFWVALGLILGIAFLSFYELFDISATTGEKNFAIGTLTTITSALVGYLLGGKK